MISNYSGAQYYRFWASVMIPGIFWQITLFGFFEKWNYPQIKGSNSNYPPKNGSLPLEGKLLASEKWLL